MNTDNKPHSMALIWALSLASILVYINLYMMQGMLPMIAQHFSVLPSVASYVLSVTTFTLAFSLLVFAIVSDKIGRRKPIVFSLVLLGISNTFLLLITNFSSLLLLRFFQGILLAAIPATAMAYFKDKLSKPLLLTAGAVYIAANSIGGIIGRLMGGLFSNYLNWTSAMALLTLVTALGVSLVIYLLPKETSKYEPITVKPVTTKLRFTTINKINNTMQGFSYHLKDKQLRLIYLIGALAFMIMVNQFSFIQLHLISKPFLLDRFQATLIFLCYLSGTLLSLLSAKAIAKCGHGQLLNIGFSAMIIGSLLTLRDNILFIFLGFFITAGGFFLLHSCANSFVAQRAQQHRAKATALYLCCYYLGASLGGPFLMPFWLARGWQGVIFGSAILLFILFIVQFIFTKENTKQNN